MKSYLIKFSTHISFCLLIGLSGIINGQTPVPTSVIAEAYNDTNIQISWQDNANNETGYILERQSSQEPWQEIATLPANTTSYNDKGLPMASVFCYRVRPSNTDEYSSFNFAFTAGNHNMYSGNDYPEADFIPFKVLEIMGTSGNDNITVSRRGAIVDVVVNGTTTSYAKDNYDEISIKGGEGNDKIVVNDGVNWQARIYGGAGSDELTYLGSEKAWLVGIGGGSDILTGNGENTSYWADQEEIDVVNATVKERRKYRVHRVTEFYQPYSNNPNNRKYVTKDQDGRRWPDDLTTTMRIFYGGNSRDKASEYSLWGRGPLNFDVQQRIEVCPQASRVQAMAESHPSLFREWAVDLGDGTYAVQHGPLNDQTYARIDDDVKFIALSPLPISKNVWWPVLLKAYYGYRLRMPIDEDPATNVHEKVEFAERGDAVSYTYNYNGSEATGYHFIHTPLMDKETLFQTCKELFDQGYGATSGKTNGNFFLGAPVVHGGHVYSFSGVYKNANGEPRFIVRNPYGLIYSTFEPSRAHIAAGFYELGLDQLVVGDGLYDLSYEQFVANYTNAYFFKFKDKEVTPNITEPSQEPSPINTDTWYHIENIGYSKYLQSTGTDDGTGNTCGGAATNIRGIDKQYADDQAQWKLIDAGNNQYYMYNKAQNGHIQVSGKRDATANDGNCGDDKTKTTRLAGKSCRGDWVKWELKESDVINEYHLYNKKSNTYMQCLPSDDLIDGNSQKGVQVRQVPTSCSDNLTRWRFIPAQESVNNSRLADSATKINQNEEEWFILKNPVSDQLEIRSQGTYGIAIFNMNGQSVTQQHNLQGNIVIDISQLPEGMYFVTYENQGFSQTKKIIIKR